MYATLSSDRKTCRKPDHEHPVIPAHEKIKMEPVVAEAGPQFHAGLDDSGKMGRDSLHSGGRYGTTDAHSNKQCLPTPCFHITLLEKTHSMLDYSGTFRHFRGRTQPEETINAGLNSYSRLYWHGCICSLCEKQSCPPRHEQDYPVFVRHTRSRMVRPCRGTRREGERETRKNIPPELPAAALVSPSTAARTDVSLRLPVAAPARRHYPSGTSPWLARGQACPLTDLF